MCVCVLYGYKFDLEVYEWLIFILILLNKKWMIFYLLRVVKWLGFINGISILLYFNDMYFDKFICFIKY